MKKVLLIVIDALASRVVLPAMDQGRLPNLQRLADAGILRPESIAIYPSLTPAATTSIISGRYPLNHGVLGFHWYDLEQDRVIYYGYDFWVIWDEGFEDFFRDFLYRLNHHQIEGKTLFQIAEKTGLKAASLNYLIFRGDTKHTASVPFWLSWLPGAPSTKEVYGPSIMYFGDLVDTDVKVISDELHPDGGMFHRFGFDDHNTAHLLIELAKKRALPDFTVAYFPDNDFRSHEVGPGNAVNALEAVDAHLGELFEIYGGLEQMLEEFCIILTGDHSQSDMVADEEAAGIRLDQLLDGYAIADQGEPWGPDDQLVVCPDMRSAQIYFRNLTEAQVDELIDRLLSDPRIDQVLWRAEVVNEEAKGYHVATSDRGRLHFWPDGEGSHSAVDRYGATWSWQGDLAAVDGQVVNGNKIHFTTYPNAFERIAGALDNKNSGHLWATACPGHEFRVAVTSIHDGGGSHGSLHQLDSVSPLFVAGAPDSVDIPDQPRTVDITPLCLTILGLQPQTPAGASHIPAARL